MWHGARGSLPRCNGAGRGACLCRCNADRIRLISQHASCGRRVHLRGGARRGKNRTRKHTEVKARKLASRKGSYAAPLAGRWVDGERMQTEDGEADEMPGRAVTATQKRTAQAM